VVHCAMQHRVRRSESLVRRCVLAGELDVKLVRDVAPRSKKRARAPTNCGAAAAAGQGSVLPNAAAAAGQGSTNAGAPSSSQVLLGGAKRVKREPPA
jgi:hypothetical protein